MSSAELLKHWRWAKELVAKLADSNLSEEGMQKFLEQAHHYDAGKSAAKAAGIDSKLIDQLLRNIQPDTSASQIHTPLLPQKVKPVSFGKAIQNLIKQRRLLRTAVLRQNVGRMAPNWDNDRRHRGDSWQKCAYHRCKQRFQKRDAKILHFWTRHALYCRLCKGRSDDFREPHVGGPEKLYRHLLDVHGIQTDAGAWRAFISAEEQFRYQLKDQMIPSLLRNIEAASDGADGDQSSIAARKNATKDAVQATNAKDSGKNAIFPSILRRPTTAVPAPANGRNTLARHLKQDYSMHRTAITAA